MTDLNVDGMAIAPGVIETIVSIAAKEVQGVAAIGSSGVGGLRSMFGSKPAAQGVEVEATENDELQVSIRIDVYYGYVIPDVAAAVRAAIADAVTAQVGISVASVDVYIDGIEFVG